MKLRTKDHVDTYKDQKDFDRSVPVSGIYDVVNLKCQWQKVGAKGTEKLRIITHVLKLIEAEDSDAAKATVGKTFGQDIWWNLMKDGKLSYNGKRLVHMTIACGNDVELDTDDRDSLVPVITGTPYRIKIRVTTTEGTNGKTFYEVDVVEAKHLSPEGRKAYSAAPDWKKLVGDPRERRLDDADYSSGGKSGGGGGGKKPDEAPPVSDGFVDDDLPF